MLTLFLRREPTEDWVWHKYGDGSVRWDVVGYRDAQAERVAFRCPWHSASRPRKGQKTVMFNCYRWNAVWLQDQQPRRVNR